MPSDNIEDLIQHAKLAEQAERYDDMVQSMRSLTKSEDRKCGLKDEERNLLSVAYKNVVGARRSSWRLLKSLLSKEEELIKKSEGDEKKKNAIEEYIKVIEKELEEKCDEILTLIDEHLLTSVSSDGEEAVQGKVFYYKMKGDYYRYLVEVADSKSEKYKSLSSKSSEAYNLATQAAKDLPSTHPIRLGLALNFSVFYYEIMLDSAKACSLAKEAFDNAIAELDSLKEDSYKDSTLIMQLLRDNLTLWSSEAEGENGDEEDQ